MDLHMGETHMPMVEKRKAQQSEHYQRYCSLIKTINNYNHFNVAHIIERLTA